VKKSLSILLLFTLLYQIFPIFEINPVQAGTTTYDGGSNVKLAEWDEYLTIQHLDSSLPYSVTVKGGTAYFNKELWEELNLVVYGDHDIVGKNDFKAGTQNPNGIPYYTDGKGVKGEYRYHGYDRTGENTITNMNFIDDATSGKSLEEKTWVYEPWNPSSGAYDKFTKFVGDKASIYNETALNHNTTDSKLVAKWINENLSFTINKTTQSTGTIITDPVHYNNVNSAPSGYSSGEGTMFHKSTTSGKVFYQTVSIPKYNKEDTPIQADMPEIAVSSIADNGDVTLSVKVTGEIMDEHVVGNSIAESIYYHRGDIKDWSFTLTNSLTSEKLTAKGTSLNKNKQGYHIFSLKIPKSAYQGVADSNGNFTVSLTGTAIANYSTGESGQATITKTKDVKGIVEEEIVVEPVIIDFDVIAPHKMLDVDKFDLRLIENDVSQAYDRYVLIDGKKLSEADEIKFLNGQYTFPRIMEDRVYSYSIVYIDTNGGIWYFSSYVVVYDSVPHAQVIVDGSHKVNRKISVSSDKSITSDYLESRSNVVISEFIVTSTDGAQIYYGSNTNELKEFLRKTEGNINVHVKVSNEYGSRTYDHQIYVAPDYEPDVISIIWNNVLTRNESLDIFSEGASLDDDTVTDITYKIYYDSNNDGNPETVVYSGNWTGSTTYKPDKLGNYKIAFTAKEEFGQPTISQHITEADKRTKTVEREFFVDNLIPMTKLYTDIEYNFPKLDVVFLTDQNLPRTDNDYLRDKNVDITNSFRANSMVANVDLWDLHTYEFTQTAYAEKHTGTSYPPATTSYSNGGYTGTLNRYNVRNYPYTVDEGGYKTFTDSRTASDSRSQSGWNANGTTTPSNIPSSVYYSSGGYSGTLSQSSYNYSSTATYNSKGFLTGYSWSRSATYSGTVTKTWTEYVPKQVTYNNYYGDYSGTVYKYVKQAYTPTYQTESNKYIIYMAKDHINNQSDINYIKDIARDAKVILIGEPSLELQFTNDYFIPYTADTNQLVNQIISITKSENSIINELSVLINQSFSLNYTDIDEEGDPIVETGFQYVHNPNYFDNPLGLEAGTVSIYSDTGYTATRKSNFTKPGKYTVYRRIKDEPIGFVSLGGYSNLGTIEITAHRKPIAAATLDWDFDAVHGTYKTSWIDQSYDPDFQYSDANKGIVDRKIKYKLGSGNWIYEIPDNLDPGTYTVEYIVMDKHGVWSDPWITTFTLELIPGLQILDAKARAEDPQFTLAGVPASENLILYDVKTRYPYDTYLDIAIYQSGIKKTTSKTVSFISGVNGIKVDNDISWANITYNIPSTLPDGDYQIRTSAIGTGGKTTYKDLSFTVKTPINLVPTTSTSLENVVSTSHDIKVTTSKYVSSVQATMFKGTGYQSVITLNAGTIQGNIKNWSKPFIVSNSIPEGTYTVGYKATTTNGQIEYVDQQLEVYSLSVIGLVSHTDLWNQHRINYNLAATGTTEQPRTIDVFFPGEKFILNADTLGTATSVLVEILGTSYSTSLFKTAESTWEGSLWHEDMMEWQSHDLIFRFTAVSAAGGTKVYDVPIRIEADPYWRQHGKF